MSKQILDIFSSIHLHGGSFCLSLSSDCVWLRLLLQAKTHPRSGPSKTGEHGPFEWGRRVCGGLSSALGVARCGRSAGCVLCVLWAMSAAALGRGVPCGGKHIIILERETCHTHTHDRNNTTQHTTRTTPQTTTPRSTPLT